MLMDRSDMQPLQMLLRTMMSNIQFLQTMSEQSSEAQAMLASVPGDGVKMAMVVVTTGPIILTVSIHPEVLYERYYGWCS